MGNLCGSKVAEPAPAPAPATGRREVSEADKATLKLKIQRDKLQQHTKKVRGRRMAGWGGWLPSGTAVGPSVPLGRGGGLACGGGRCCAEG
jgi:hypothetical protein